MMKSVNPDELNKHRVFFTEFDRLANHHSLFAVDTSNYHSIIIERKLKLLILTKAHIVIAVSQLLESPLAHSLLLSYPNLLKDEAIIPSLRLEYNSSTHFLEWKRQEAMGDIKNPYHSGIAVDIAKLIDENGKAVRWNLSDMSDWFRDRLVNDMENDSSMLRLSLRQQGIILPSSLPAQLKSIKGLTRGKVVEIVHSSKNEKLIHFLKAYSDFIYYLSGARTTRSEGVLPQENLLDFSISDLIYRRTKLTEYEIFFKIFIDIVKAKTSTIFPIDFLDSISINDALELRNIALTKQFTEKYNSIQLKIKEALQIKDPEKLVLLLNELDKFEAELHLEFSTSLDKELPTRIREQKARSAGKVIHSIASLIIPGYSPESYRDILVSGLRFLGRTEAAKRVERKINDGIKAAENFMEDMSILDRQILLDFVDEMKMKYQERMFEN